MKNKYIVILRSCLIALLLLVAPIRFAIQDSHSVLYIVQLTIQELDCSISEYDDIFRREVQQLGWDWRMLAAIVWNESRFNNGAVSSQRARGLMQFMPRTAERFGLVGDDVLVPQKSIGAGVEYLLFLERRFNEIKDRDERIKFILAGYNAGPGHVRDAMALAQKYGDDPHTWGGSVEKWLLALQESKYYNDEVCRHGFFRGRYTVKYVMNVFTKYREYTEKINYRKFDYETIDNWR